MVLGVVAFALQIYNDFSGYSDIAIGTARLFGRCQLQYFSRDLGEFWRRWHVSLNTWFRDYLYITLGGSRMGRGRSLLNVVVVFLVSGLWHGADWKFVTWGGIHAARASCRCSSWGATGSLSGHGIGASCRPRSGRSPWCVCLGSFSAPTTSTTRATCCPAWRPDGPPAATTPLGPPR